ncbi:hypothetical protein C8Q75DRAFT_792307 [Abortiporus biennis]|nr:hypothetical protein C8Q75DRAFT_792307 [Abortiporus biennis]
MPRNPFRDPSGRSSRQTSPSPVAGPSQIITESDARRETPPTVNVIAPSNSTPEPSSSQVDVDTLTEELPPAYTPAPDVYHGETTVELGPRRPFQQAPPPLQTLQPIQTQQTGWPPYTTGPNNWSGFPGLQTQSTGSNSRFAPPPRHPRSPTRSHNLRRPSPSRPVSDFARDFYAAGGDVDPIVVSAEDAGSRASSASVQFAPPPGQPPSTSSSRSTASSNGGVPNDGKPTKSPVPGHPLLLNGKVLVYPAHYECPKCRNTGYKNFDPSQPCNKCWQRYSKTYTGAITYAPWSSSANTPSDSNTSLQRPLPSFAPPQANLRQTRSLHRPSQSMGNMTGSSQAGLSRSASSSRLDSGYPGASAQHSRVLPLPGGGIPLSSYLDNLGRSVNSNINAALGGPTPRVATGYAPPPPGAQSYRPGDPRIGGRLCWRCGGSGTISFLVFDERSCPVCDGIGRTFN